MEEESRGRVSQPPLEIMFCEYILNREDYHVANVQQVSGINDLGAAILGRMLHAGSWPRGVQRCDLAVLINREPVRHLALVGCAMEEPVSRAWKGYWQKAA